jgi:hypothetical protein
VVSSSTFVKLLALIGGPIGWGIAMLIIFAPVLL